MHTEGSDQAGRGLAAEAMAAEGALRELKNLRRAGCGDTEEGLPINRALSGLLVAVPMSLVFWMVIGMLLWALVR